MSRPAAQAVYFLIMSRNSPLIEELATVVLAEFDAETRFRARAALGSREEGLRLLAKLDEAHREDPPSRLARWPL